MIPPDFPHGQPAERRRSVVREGDLERRFVDRLAGLKSTCRPDIRDRAVFAASRALRAIHADTPKHVALAIRTRGLMRRLFPSPEEVAA